MLPLYDEMALRIAREGGASEQEKTLVRFMKGASMFGLVAALIWPAITRQEELIKETIQQMHGSLKSDGTTKEHLQALQTQYQNAVKDVEGSKNTVAQMQTELDTAKTEHETAIRNLQEQHSLAVEQKNKDNIAEVERVKKEAGETLAQKTLVLQEMETEIGTLIKTVEEQRTSIKQFRGDYDGASQKIQAMTEDLRLARQEVETKQGEITEWSTKFGTLTTESGKQAESLATKEKEITRMEGELSQLQKTTVRYKN
jgi:chromosome segregation ATPase